MGALVFVIVKDSCDRQEIRRREITSRVQLEAYKKLLDHQRKMSEIEHEKRLAIEERKKAKKKCCIL